MCFYDHIIEISYESEDVRFFVFMPLLIFKLHKSLSKSINYIKHNYYYEYMYSFWPLISQKKLNTDNTIPLNIYYAH